MGRLELAYSGHSGHDFYTSVAAADADAAFAILEAWGGDVAVTYNVFIPETNSSEARTATISSGNRIYGRISNVVVTDGGTVLAYFYPEA